MSVIVTRVKLLEGELDWVQKKYIDIRKLKIFARENLSGPLKEVLLVEHDELYAVEFSAKSEAWLTGPNYPGRGL